MGDGVPLNNPSWQQSLWVALSGQLERNLSHDADEAIVSSVEKSQAVRSFRVLRTALAFKQVAQHHLRRFASFRSVRNLLPSVQDKATRLSATITPSC